VTKSLAKLPAPRRASRYRQRKLLGLGVGLLIVLLSVLADKAGLLGVFQPADLTRYDNQTFLVARVIDGDTLDLETPDGKNVRTRVRLWGVDTPETVHPDRSVEHFGPEASAFSRELAQGRYVRIELDHRSTRDKYGRLLAYIHLPDGRMLNRLIVEQGYGYADPRFDHRYDNEFSRLMNRAAKARVGLWKDAMQTDLPAYLQGRVKLGSAAPPAAPRTFAPSGRRHGTAGLACARLAA
jgi:endonuclease YncB( thermonuclease family)